jgi:hypothetical protein
MADTTNAAATDPAPATDSKFKTWIVRAAKWADDTAWNIWDSGLLKKSVTVPAKALFVGALVILGASLFVKVVHKISPEVAQTVGIEDAAPQCTSAKVAELPKAKQAEKKTVSKPVKHTKKAAPPRNSGNFGFFN